jgi:hypothetical protein
MEVRGQFHAKFRKKSPRYPLGRRMSWPYEQSGRGDKEKNSVPVGNRTMATQAAANHFAD